MKQLVLLICCGLLIAFGISKYINYAPLDKLAPDFAKGEQFLAKLADDEAKRKAAGEITYFERQLAEHYAKQEQERKELEFAEQSEK